MASRDVTTGEGAAGADLVGGGVRGAARRLTTETKSFFKTSEFWTYLVILIAILIAGNSIEGEEGGADVFAADDVWLYVTLLTIGYLLSRGLAKSGSRDPYWDRPGGTGEGAGLADRIRTAAEAAREGGGGGAGGTAR